MSETDRSVQAGGFEHFAEVYDRFAPGAKITPPPDHRGFRWSGSLAKKSGRSVLHAHLNCNITTTADDNSDLLGLIVPHVGGVRAISRGCDIVAVPGQAVILRLADKRVLESRVSAGKHVRLTMTWSLSNWQKLFAALREDIPARQLDFDGLIDFSGAKAQVFFRLLDALVHDIADSTNDMGLTSVLMNEALLRLAFDAGARVAGRGQARRGGYCGSRSVRIASEFMRANLSEPICMADVASACGITVRTLEAGFRAHLGTTPMAFLRQLRMQAVRSELLCDQTCLPISTIARTFGFGDMGRFAARYREAFGELPSETVRRR